VDFNWFSYSKSRKSLLCGVFPAEAGANPATAGKVPAERDPLGLGESGVPTLSSGLK
jgi:hypothetical protein